MTNKNEPIITQDEWYRELFKKIEKPEGSFSASEIAKQLGKPLSTVRAFLNKQVDAGEVTSIKLPSPTGGSPITYYYPTKKQSKK